MSHFTVIPIQGTLQFWYHSCLQVFDWTNGWNEQSATAFCENYILGRSSVQACDVVPDTEQQEAIDTCVLDIKVSLRYIWHISPSKECFKAKKKILSITINFGLGRECDK